MKNLKSTRLACVLALTTCAPSVLAEDLTDLPLEALLNITVSAASKYEQKSSEAPSSVTVLTADDIRAHGWNTLSQALASLRGVYITSDRSYEFIGTRGFGLPGDFNSRVLLKIDGYRTNDAVYDQAYIGRDVPLDMDLVERIEYAPGPGSVLDGSNAFFGVVNVVTKKGRTVNGAQVAANIDSQNTREGRLSYGKRFENSADLLLSVSGYRSDNNDDLHLAGSPDFLQPDFARVHNNDDGRDKELFAKLALPMGLTLEGVFGDRHKQTPTGQYGQVFNDSRTYVEDKSYFLQAAYEQALNKDLSMKARLFAGGYKYTGSYVFLAAPDTPYKSDETGEGKSWGTELNLIYRGFSNHTVLAGLEYNNKYQLDQLYHDELGGVLDSTKDSYNYGLFVQDDWAFLPNWRLNLGVRTDWDNITQDHRASPRVAMIHNVNEATTVKAIYGKAFRSPNAYELYYGIDSYAQMGNLSLKPETISNFELAIERNTGDTRWLASAYHYTLKDLSLQADNGGFLQFQNCPTIDANGLELEAERKFNNGLRLRTSYAWQKVESIDLPNSPRHNAKINMTMPLFANQALLGVEGQYVSSRISQDGAANAKPEVLVNLNLSSDKLIPKVDLSLGIHNVFNRHNEQPASTDIPQLVNRQDGRIVNLKAVYNF